MHASRQAATALLTGAALALAGCNLIYPFNVTAIEDASLGRDAPADDVGPAHDAEAGLSPLETGTDPDQALDAGPRVFPCKDSSNCVECEPATNKDCTLACSPSDCDGLPDARDPWLGECNKLLFDDDFIGCCSGWQRIHGGQNIYEKPCGVLELDVASHTTQWMRLTASEAGKLPDDYLVELRFFPPAAKGRWTLELRANTKGRQVTPGRLCKVDYDPAKGLATLSGSINGQQLKGSASANINSGGVLQSWLTGDRFFCRLNSSKLTSDVLQGQVPKGDTLEVAVLNPQYQPRLYFYLDYVRLFEPGP